MTYKAILTPHRESRDGKHTQGSLYPSRGVFRRWIHFSHLEQPTTTISMCLDHFAILWARALSSRWSCKTTLVHLRAKDKSVFQVCNVSVRCFKCEKWILRRKILLGGLGALYIHSNPRFLLGGSKSAYMSKSADFYPPSLFGLHYNIIIIYNYII